MKYYAHSIADQPKEVWHPLDEHLGQVAELAARFADAFASAEWGRLAGLWHDLGKFQDEFQKRLEGETGAVPHAAVGALHAHSVGRELGLPIAFVIAGHHSGLPNLSAHEPHQPTPLMQQLRQHRERYRGVHAAASTQLTRPEFPAWPDRFTGRDEMTRRSLEFWIRFVFSALVDADFLDTEEFFEKGKRTEATLGFDAIPALRERLDRGLGEVAAKAEPTKVNTMRSEVLGACRAAASRPPGSFSLTVPTGGGKTLSAMAFALHHAERHGLRRVVAVIPYTSIIEQNAAVYRGILGDHNVIEHHSNLDPETETSRNKLASENWDAPIIVTTGVQFFESLFANRSSRCRKLHNLSRSVVLLDEAQMFPPGFLLAILDGLRELVTNFGCSIVLSTATQPALTRRDSLPQGLEDVHEIIPDPARLFGELERVDIRWPSGDLGGDSTGGPAEWSDLAKELAGHDQVLAIVHRRKDARDLANHLPAEGTYHLSALMCPRHRTEVLARAQEALARGETCRLVSTQLVEAGVDIDFPVVYRAFGGLDSVAQAAGRCNREGRLDRGQLIIFEAPTPPPRGTPKRGLETLTSMLEGRASPLRITDPAEFETYFRRLYFAEDLDVRGVQAEREQLSFANVAQKFEMIQDWASRPVVVPYGDAESRVAALRSEGPSRKTLRALQPYSVNIYSDEYEALMGSGALETIGEAVQVLTTPYADLYKERFGLVVEETPMADPGTMVV